MQWIYLASAIFGGSFLLPMILGGLASDVDVDFDTDVDTDFDLDTDFDTDFDTGEIDLGELDAAEAGSSVSPLGAGVDAGQAILGSILSFRSIVFFATFFGVAGLVFGLLGYGTLTTAITAVALGLVAAMANSTLWGLMKSSESSSQVSERTFQGRPAIVTVPIEPAHRGRIRIELAGQPHYLVAKALEAESAIAVGLSVVVVEIENGIAVVAPLPELD